MAIDYVKAAATAQRLITENGISVTLQKASRGTRDPNKPWRGPEADIPPAIASGMRMDYNPALGVTVDANNRVTQLLDQSGNAHTLVNGSGLGPLLVPSGLGFPELRFDGGQWLENLAVPDIDPPFTLFVVVNMDAPADPDNPTVAELRNALIDYDTPTGLNDGALMGHNDINGGETEFRYEDASAIGVSAGPPLVDSLWHLMEGNATFDGVSAGVLCLHLDGTEVDRPAWSGFNSDNSTNLSIGRIKNLALPNFGLKGSIRRILIYGTTALTLDQRVATRQALMETYGVGQVVTPAVLLSYNETDIDGEIIRRGDRKALVAFNGAEPEDIRFFDTLVEANGDKWRIQNVNLLEPADTGILYTLQLRR